MRGFFLFLALAAFALGDYATAGDWFALVAALGATFVAGVELGIVLEAEEFE